MRTFVNSAAAKQWSEAKIRGAVDQLLHRLRDWVRVYPLSGDTPFPEHDIAFVTGPDGGPEQCVMEVIKSSPDLWMHAVPTEVIFVPRSALKTFGVPDIVIEAWRGAAANMILCEAAAQQQTEKIPGRRAAGDHSF